MKVFVILTEQDRTQAWSYTTLNFLFNYPVFRSPLNYLVRYLPGHHPNSQIYMLMTSPVADLKNGPLSLLVKNLTNLNIKYLNVDSFIEGTPLETLWRKGDIASSQYLVSI